MIRRGLIAASFAAAGLVAMPSFASAQEVEPILDKAVYDDATTYSCRTPVINIQPGQNLNNFGGTKTCPNPAVVSGPGNTSVFSSSDPGYITRFKPSMLEITESGLVTPSVYDLHLHHVVWIKGGKPTFASGEEKTEVMLPEGYGIRANGNENWTLNDMIHSLTADSGRQVYLTWEIDWVPLTQHRRGGHRGGQRRVARRRGHRPGRDFGPRRLRRRLPRLRRRARLRRGRRR